MLNLLTVHVLQDCKPIQTRCHYSTETALLHTMDSVFRSSDPGQPSLLVSLDMSAAFDTIDHSILLNRLSVEFGVSGSVLTWLKSYLTGRYQCVRVGQASSSHTLCHTGVPQGSVLGPILFSCYISPISFIANTFGVGIQQYADDTQLYVSLSPTDMHAQQSLLSDCLSALHSWFCHNGLALNSTKSESILIGTRQCLRTHPPIASPTIGFKIRLSVKYN